MPDPETKPITFEPGAPEFSGGSPQQVSTTDTNETADEKDTNANEAEEAARQLIDRP